MNYVIIGNSAGGISAVQAIRECDQKGKITVISDEKYVNYSRPLISYLLGKRVDRRAIAYRAKDFYNDNKANLILGSKATKLELKQRKVVLANRQKISFDKLLIATGGMPIVPQIKGAGARGVYTFVNLADEEKIEKYIQTNKVKQAVVIGGGLIGLKTTEALIELKIKVAIVELADRILSASLDRKASGLIEQALQNAGGSLIANNTAQEIKEENGRVKEVILKDQRRIPADLVILAIGVRPNIELVKNTPIKTNKGILADEYMQTNIPGIYAAGDCAEARDLVLNINRPIAIWPAAVRQGKIAGFNMAGEKRESKGNFAMNSVELCGRAVISVGESCPAQAGFELVERFEPQKAIYKKIVLRNNRITGTIFVGDIERAGLYTGLLDNQIDVTDFKDSLLKDDFGLLSLPQTYRKHLVSAGEAVII